MIRLTKKKNGGGDKGRKPMPASSRGQDEANGDSSYGGIDGGIGGLLATG